MQGDFIEQIAERKASIRLSDRKMSKMGERSPLSERKMSMISEPHPLEKSKTLNSSSPIARRGSTLPAKANKAVNAAELEWDQIEEELTDFKAKHVTPAE